MVIRGRAPLRVSFGGGGTDVAPFCVEQGGAIIGSTINKYAYCSIVPREDDQIIVHSLDFDMTVKYNAKENFVYDGRLDLVTAALKAMDINQGCEVYLQCDAPAGSGLELLLPLWFPYLRPWHAGRALRWMRTAWQIWLTRSSVRI